MMRDRSRVTIIRPHPSPSSSHQPESVIHGPTEDLRCYGVAESRQDSDLEAFSSVNYIVVSFGAFYDRYIEVRRQS